MARGLRVLALLVFAFSLFEIGTAQAVEPNEILKDPKLEKRARKISAELRCLVCQNQSIDDSNAPLAHDLRVLVRERLTAGDSDADIFEYVVARYGTYVLLKPPFNVNTLLLWLAPFLILMFSSFLIFRSYRGRTTEGLPASVEGLSEDEQAALDAIMTPSVAPDESARKSEH